MPGGRWRIIGTQVRFTEPDEAEAIEKFRKLKDPIEHSNLPRSEKGWLKTSTAEIVDGNALIALIRVFALVGEPQEAWRKFWRYVAEEIRTKPKLIVRETGIEELAYLPKPTKPKPLPSFDELTKIWEQHPTTSTTEVKKVKAAWNAFVTGAKVRATDDITDERCVAYRDKVYAKTAEPKYQQHLFNRARRMLTFAASRAIATKEIAEALVAMILLTPRDTTTSVDPKPIEREDFAKIVGSGGPRRPCDATSYAQRCPVPR